MDATIPQRRSAWVAGLIGALVTLVAVVGVIAVLWRLPAVRTSISQDLAPPRTWPGRTDFRLRRVLLDRRDQAVAAGDLRSAADIHADLSQEALLRARAVLRAWLPKQNPSTRLFPRSPEVHEWRYRDSGADLFGFLLQAAMQVDPEALPRLELTLDAERKLAPAGQLCIDANSDTGAPVQASHDVRLFNSSEYVKDGLLSVYEGHGDSPLAAPAVRRMFEVLDNVIANSKEPSTWGPMPGQGSEENGNVLQACSRLGFSAGHEAYAEMAARIAEAVVSDVLPKNHGLPATFFDYGNHKVIEADVHLRDHGNEVIAGLSEAYALAVARRNEPAWADRADRWAAPIAAMYELAVTRGVNSEGLIASRIDPQSLKLTSPRANDNWGYVLNGVLLFSQAARKHGKLDVQKLDALEASADKIIDAVVKQYGIDWERDQTDGYADSLESAMYVASHRPSRRRELMSWVDDQMALLYSRQQDSGLVDNTYLDGNFIRTTLMYADQKRGGWRVSPWRDDVRLGYADDGKGNAKLVIRTGAAYRGTLRADPPRHSTILHLPWNWPRLNSWPEWSALGEGTRVISTEGVAGDSPTIDALQSGLSLDLPAHATVVLSFQQEAATGSAK